ncbi:hypothetical protein TrVE_jg8958 [Triparma verrucosa]|uniref:PDZ domain-containing protein n=1 Tax=Triparma verrucosa TaxID=1606542 RepID=A0A9W7DMP4_9STRA|nr:hypothetical protein TrVE_jg8958 [Triparma verrucosa]
MDSERRLMSSAVGASLIAVVSVLAIAITFLAFQIRSYLLHQRDITEKMSTHFTANSAKSKSQSPTTSSDPEDLELGISHGDIVVNFDSHYSGVGVSPTNSPVISLHKRSNVEPSKSNICTIDNLINKPQQQPPLIVKKGADQKGARQRINKRLKRRRSDRSFASQQSSVIGDSSVVPSVTPTQPDTVMSGDEAEDEPEEDPERWLSNQIDDIVMSRSKSHGNNLDNLGEEEGALTSDIKSLISKASSGKRSFADNVDDYLSEAESVSSNKSMGLRSDTGEVVKLQKSYYEKVIQNIKEQRDAEIKEREDEEKKIMMAELKALKEKKAGMHLPRVTSDDERTFESNLSKADAIVDAVDPLKYSESSMSTLDAALRVLTDSDRFDDADFERMTSELRRGELDSPVEKTVSGEEDFVASSPKNSVFATVQDDSSVPTVNTTTSANQSSIGAVQKVKVPLGSLGIVIGRPSSKSLLPQAVYIFSISPTSPLSGKVEPGDVIEMVGEESCEGLGGRGVTKMLQERGANTEIGIRRFLHGSFALSSLRSEC